MLMTPPFSVGLFSAMISTPLRSTTLNGATVAPGVAAKLVIWARIAVRSAASLPGCERSSFRLTNGAVLGNASIMR